MDRRTWSPFQSKKVREVCEHMTEAEKDEVARQAAVYGIWTGITFAVPVGFVVMLWVAQKLAVPDLFPFQIPLVPAIYVLAVLLIVQMIRVIRVRRKQKELFASTEWARAQGYTVENL